MADVLLEQLILRVQPAPAKHITLVGLHNEQDAKQSDAPESLPLGFVEVRGDGNDNAYLEGEVLDA
jgi:hypothetical protein